MLCKRDLAAVRMVECPTCSKLFRSQDGLTVHVAKDHEVGTSTEVRMRYRNLA